MSSLIVIKKTINDNNILGAINQLKAFAEKFDSPDISSWCSMEMHGYKETDEIPPYRIISTDFIKIVAGYKDYPENLNNDGYGYFDSASFIRNQEYVLSSITQSLHDFKSFIDTQNKNGNLDEIQKHVKKKEIKFHIGLYDFLEHLNIRELIYNDTIIDDFQKKHTALSLPNGLKLNVNYSYLTVDKNLLKEKILKVLQDEIIVKANQIDYKRKLKNGKNESQDFGSNNHFNGDILINSKNVDIVKKIEIGSTKKMEKENNPTFWNNVNVILAIIVSMITLISSVYAAYMYFMN